MQTLSTQSHNRIPIILIAIFLSSLRIGYGQEIKPNKFRSKDTLSIYQAASADGDYRSTMPNYIPVSPTAGSLINLVDYPIFYYKGTQPQKAVPQQPSKESEIKPKEEQYNNFLLKFINPFYEVCK